MTGAPTALPDLVATYRLQLHAGFTFSDAAAIVPYLADLGISHLYLSPIMQAAPRSTHGYDQCDPTRVSVELGGASGFEELAGRARARGLGILLDIVPNHMAAAETNPWWWELLRSGREGPAGAYFDIDWDPPQRDLRARVMIPILGAPLTQVLAAGELTVVEHGGEPALAYGDRHLPLAAAAAVAVGDRVTLELLDRQHYRLAFWRDAPQQLNYRRFFDIDTLVGVREEDPEVFATLHALVLKLVEHGDVQGLRVDHVDGLRDPRGYLETLRARAPEAWLLVEKILAPGEQLPAGWPVQGTTGYEFIQRQHGVFVDPDGEASLTALYRDFTAEPVHFAEVALEGKLEAARRLFGTDLGRLERLLDRVCLEDRLESAPETRVEAIRQVAARLPVYRTYGTTGALLAADERARVDGAVAAARAVEGIPPWLLDLIRDVLCGARSGPSAVEFMLRFQQFSGPLAAKGVEDTALYRYNRLVSLNEVGGDPGTFGVSPAAFHEASRTVLASHPTTMLASSTHDTKRSEDVRARLALLAQVPDTWGAAVRRWSTLNKRYRRGAQPDRDVEYLLYQALVGAWPLSLERALAYVEKAAREARRHTSWTDPDPGYEDALRAYVRAIMEDEEFQAQLGEFTEGLVGPGREVSLAQALLKLTAPGVPDIYQGTELWDLSLVDPDNRRPVDYEARRELLARQQAAVTTGHVDPQLILGRWDEGLAKLHVTARALGARRAAPAAFGAGSTYTPLSAEGPASRNVLAFARGTLEDPAMVVTVVPRLTLRGRLDWAGTKLDPGPGHWDNVLWGGRLLDGPGLGMDAVFERYPLALLVRSS